MHSKRIREKVKRDYDVIADDFSLSRRHAWSEFEFFLPYYKPRFKVLDLGCGNGRLADFLAKKGFAAYTGVDQSKNLLKIAQQKHPNLRFLQRDMTELSDLSQEWDAVFMIASFHHLPQADQTNVLKQVYGILKTDGYLFMTNWNLYQRRFWRAWLEMIFFRPLGWKGLSIRWQNTVRRYYYGFTGRELLRLLRGTGFQVLEIQVGRNLVTVAQK